MTNADIERYRDQAREEEEIARDQNRMRDAARAHVRARAHEWILNSLSNEGTT